MVGEEDRGHLGLGEPVYWNTLYTWRVIFGQGFAIDSNTNVPQYGAGMYPGSYFMFNFKN